MAKQTFTTGQVLTASEMQSLQATAMGGGSATAKTASYVLVAADAGTTVIMNSASATTITVNTSLFSAGDTVFLQNIGAGVCTVTAGTATVNTASSLALAQYASGNLYFTAAGASIFSKADGAAAGAGSGLTLISTVPVTASAGNNFDDVFSTTYDNYRIVSNLVGASAMDATMKLRVGGVNTSTNYLRQNLNSSVSTTTSSNNTSQTDMLFGEIHSTFSIQIYDITGPFLAQRTSMIGMYGHSTGSMRITYQAQTDATSFTSFALIFSANATGTVSVYGYAKA